MIKREDSITVLKGIGEKTAERFAAAGICSVQDLIDYYPVRYEQYEPPCEITETADGQITAVCGFLERQPTVRRAGAMTITTGKIMIPGAAAVQAVWFNMPYLRGRMQTGKLFVFRGRVRRKGRTVTLQQPQLFDPEDYTEKCSVLQPVYPLVKGLTNNTLRKAILQALEKLPPEEEEYLPEKIRSRYAFPGIFDMRYRMHFPEKLSEMQSARNRLAFEEFLFFLQTVSRLKEQMKSRTGAFVLHPVPETDLMLRSLPFTLTGAQTAAWQQISREMTGISVMNRMIQGDVGSGKTIIAFLALICAAGNGKQGALMVPTEVLARQHFASFTAACEKAGIDCRPVLLTGSLPAAKKRRARERIESGQAGVIIGTHALIQEQVTFHDLALVITDEQHRFGVSQRGNLTEKGKEPHILVMSATPIPRSLAAILYGDLDITVIDEMPADRLPVKNCVVGKAWRPNAYEFIRKEVRSGHQAYVICPLVDPSEAVEAENVTEYSEKLQRILGEEIPVAMLHGKMGQETKNRIMDAFAEGSVSVLVSTTVVEVGVDVPNASVMMIEDAQRFGLAQLHQLRGRVGRGKAQSYCIFVCTQETKENQERLKILEQSNDGFEIARNDLGMRGPGDLLGVRQSGEAQFLVADLYRDADLLEKAKEASEWISGEILTNSDEIVQRFQNKLLLYQENKLKNLNI